MCLNTLTRKNGQWSVHKPIYLRPAAGVPVAPETRFPAKALCPPFTDDDRAQHAFHWLLVGKYLRARGASGTRHPKSA
jgi:hypothetical protein